MTDNPQPAPGPDGPVLVQTQGVEPSHPPASGHEHSDANVRAIVWFGVILAAVAVAVHIVLAVMFFAFRAREDREKRTRFPLAAGQESRQLTQPDSSLSAPVRGVLPGQPRLEGLNLEGPAHDVGLRAEGTGGEKNESEEDILSKGLGKPGAPRTPIAEAMRQVVQEESKGGNKQKGGVRYDLGVPGTGGDSNSGRDLPEAQR
jgi:hypothetical protein